jgi:hypothetical protein
MMSAFMAGAFCTAYSILTYSAWVRGFSCAGTARVEKERKRRNRAFFIKVSDAKRQFPVRRRQKPAGDGGCFIIDTQPAPTKLRSTSEAAILLNPMGPEFEVMIDGKTHSLMVVFPPFTIKKGRPIGLPFS